MAASLDGAENYTKFLGVAPLDGKNVVFTDTFKATYISGTDADGADVVVGVFNQDLGAELVDGRTCNRCGDFMLWKFFNKDPKGIAGYRSICRICTGMRSHGVFDATPRVRVSKQASWRGISTAREGDDRPKRCPKCTERKTRGDFHNNKTAFDGKNVYCKECRKGDRHKRNKSRKARK